MLYLCIFRKLGRGSDKLSLIMRLILNQLKIKNLTCLATSWRLQEQNKAQVILTRTETRRVICTGLSSQWGLQNHAWRDQKPLMTQDRPLLTAKRGSAAGSEYVDKMQPVNYCTLQRRWRLWTLGRIGCLPGFPSLQTHPSQASFAKRCCENDAIRRMCILYILVL